MTETAKQGSPAPESGEDGLEAFKEMLGEQRERQGKLRHVQQFLTSPLFFDLRDKPIDVSDPPEVIEEHKRDLDYRIRVLESLTSMLTEERALLERTQSTVSRAQGEADSAGPGQDAPQTGGPEQDKMQAKAQDKAQGTS